MVDPGERERPLSRTNKERKSVIMISYTNIDGLVSKRLELLDYLREKKPDIMCIVETKLTEDINLILDEKCNYNIYRNDRKEGRGGGVIVLTTQNIKVSDIKYGSDNTENICIQITTNNSKLHIIAAYVPPKTRNWNEEKYKSMLDKTERFLQNQIHNSKKVILTGDFNCKEVNWENYEAEGNEFTWGNRLLKLTTDNLMTQWVREETRLRGNDEPSRLDLVFTKGTLIKQGVKHHPPLGKSDHEVLEFDIPTGEERRNKETHKNKRRNYVKANYEGLKKYFGDLDWSEMYNAEDIQSKYDLFLKNYNNGVEKYVPFYVVKEQGKSEWFNWRCEKAKRNKNRAWRDLKKRPNKNNSEKYKKARNDYVSLRREVERNYQKRIVDKCKDEPKLFYRFINGKLKKSDCVTKLKDGGKIFEEDKELAEILNKNFQKVFTQETSFNPDQQLKQGKLKCMKVDKEELMTIMRKLDGRKAMGPDAVSGQVLKECSKELLEPLYNIINCSVNSGKVPKEWKRADIVPIYKSGDKQEPLNYRPVSLTSVVCKICEIIIKKRWSQHLERGNAICNSQFGFRQGRSCVSNLLCFYSRAIDVIQEKDGWADCVYLDLKKAFDKVPHNRLIWKLQQQGGLGGKMLEWMKDYLTNREMRTMVKNEKSEWRRVTSGVPQGSVLAPVMFLIYINDMPEKVHSYMSMFADDAKLMKRVRQKEDCEDLQRDLDRVYEWSQTWEMEFNAKKCHVMELGRSKNRPTKLYKMGNEILNVTKEEKDLGVTFQDTLSPEKHINRIFGQAYGTLQNIRVAFQYMDKGMMKKIITTMIRPKLEYAAVTWSPHCKKHVSKLERIQRIATKIIPELADKSYEGRLKELNLPTLEQRRERGDLITLFKLINGIDVMDREDLLIPRRKQGLRGHGKELSKPTCQKNIRKYSFPYRNIEVWNSLDRTVVEAGSVHQLKARLDKYRYGDGTVRA